MQQTLAVGRKALKLAQAKGDAELIGMINDQLRQSASPLAGTEPPPADQVFRFPAFAVLSARGGTVCYQYSGLTPSPLSSA
jgi:hypothetical protein